MQASPTRPIHENFDFVNHNQGVNHLLGTSASALLKST